MKLLVIRFSSMGDVILTTPIFSYAKSIWPDVSITFVTDHMYVELFKDDPRLASVVGLSREDSIDELKKVQWDVVADLQNNHRSHRLTNAISSKRTSVFDKLHLKRFALLFTRINCYDPEETVVKRYLKTLTDEPIKDIPTTELFLNCDDKQELKAMLKSGPMVRPIIVLFPFSNWRNKEWPESYFAKLGRFYHTKGWNVVIMGGPDDRARSNLLRVKIGVRCMSFAGKLSLYECGCLIKNCSLALGVDTGLSHMARALGVKTGMIFGPTSGHWGFYPYGNPEYKVFEQNFFCRPCHAHGGNICCIGRQCMQRIKPEVVIRQLDSMFHGQ